MRRLVGAGVALAALLASPGRAADPGRAAFVAWARDHAAPLPDCAKISDTADWKRLDGLVGQAHVVALGEPVHGAQEPLALRNCLFRALVEQKGFTAIAIESGLSESRRLHDFVAGGPGDVTTLVHDSLTWGFGRFADNVALIEWMRAYNLDPSHPRKIAFYGMDLSGGDADGAWRRARRTIDASLDYLAHADPARSTGVRATLLPFVGRFTVPGYVAMTPLERTRLRVAIGGLIRYFDRNRGALIAASSLSNYDWARQNAVAAGQLGRTFLVSRAPGTGEDIAPQDYRADAARDAAMAANVRWIVDREGPAGRVLVFAHDGHVMNAATRGGIWSVYAHPPMSMGQHLRAAFGKSLLIVPIASPADDPHGSGEGQSQDIDGALEDTGLDRFMVDYRKRPKGAAAGWFESPKSMRMNYSTWAVVRPERAFDALIFVRSLNPEPIGVP